MFLFTQEILVALDWNLSNKGDGELIRLLMYFREGYNRAADGLDLGFSQRGITMTPRFGAWTIGWMNGQYERETWTWLHWNKGFIERTNIEVCKGHNSW